jgi:peptide/nickel transport system substrate-binding protein
MRVLSTRAGRCGVLLVGIVFSLLCFGEAALAQKRGGVLRMFHRDNPPSTSILEEFSPSTVVPFMPVFNNLVAFDPSVPQNSDKSIVPDLAESWSWNDDKTELTFKLRRGVKWHDGWAFTAADVECTFNLLTGRARDKLRHNPRGSWYGNINYVHGGNDYEVTIHLNHPQPSLLTLLASGLSPIYPCHVPSAQMRIKPVGTGPFKLESFKQFDSVRLVRNPDYFKPGKPHLDGIEFHIVSSPSTAMLSFVAGRFDITFPWEVTIPQLRDVRRQ